MAVRYIYQAFGSQLAKLGNGEAKYTYGGKELDDENWPTTSMPGFK